MYIYIYYIFICVYIDIHRHVFRPSQDSSVWLGLTSKEHLMSPECSKHQVFSFVKMLLVNENKFRVYISTDIHT